jgi:general secretion pathway protein H
VKRGFTLVELLVVLAIVALGSASVMWRLRDSSTQQLESEAQRLCALLEAARAQSRANGVAIRWRAVDGGFLIESLQPGSAPPQTYGWLNPSTRATSTYLSLGPEPIVAPQSLSLLQGDGRGVSVRISTDGLRPFSLVP